MAIPFMRRAGATERSRLLAVWLLLLCPVLPLRAASWEVWDDCRLEADQYFDGDSFHVRHRSAVTIFRIYFVDAPETDGGYPSLITEQASHFKVSPSAVVRGGDTAKAFTAKFLAGKFRVLTRLQPAPGASRSQRYYGIVQVEGRRLDAALVSAGLARVSGELADFPDATQGREMMLTLRRAELAAAKARQGVWALARETIAEPLQDAVKPRLGGKAGAGQALSRINLNTATAIELESLPGIGPKTAEVLIRARPIKDLAALDAIPGFGPKKIEALRDLIRFE